MKARFAIDICNFDCIIPGEAKAFIPLTVTDASSAPTTEIRMGRTVAPDDGWAALIINQVVDTDGKVLGYIFVMNPDRPDAKWKFAGGHKEPEGTPLESARRENKDETGLRLPTEAYTELTDLLEWRKNHWSILFLAKVPID
jgi:8-oxo-dGTP pyrophosphatase MutT (NUDIX family)